MRKELGYVLECDLDLVLTLDTRVGGPISRHLLAVAGFEGVAASAATRSVGRCGGSRETDVEISWSGGALLVEHKVDARFTDGQPESYAAEVVERRSRGDLVAAILVCPSRRNSELAHEANGSFDRIITCDELAEVAERAGDSLSLGAAMVYRAAEQRRPSYGGTITPWDPERSEWGERYRAVVDAVQPAGAGLSVAEGGLRTATATVATFRGPTKNPVQVWKVLHDLSLHVVVSELEPGIEPDGLPSGARLIRKKVQRCVAIDVAPIDLSRPPLEQADEIREVVAAVLHLREWAAESFPIG